VHRVAGYDTREPLSGPATTLLTDGGREIFRGDLAAAAGFFADELLGKFAVRAGEEKAVRASCLADGVADLPGVVRILGTAPFMLEGIRAIRRGGVLVAGGDVRIRGPVLKGAGADQVLTIVSAGGRHLRGDARHGRGRALRAARPA